MGAGGSYIFYHHPPAGGTGSRPEVKLLYQNRNARKLLHETAGGPFYQIIDFITVYTLIIIIMPSSLSCGYPHLLDPPFGSYFDEGNCQGLV